jgi:hypothetical protein
MCTSILSASRSDLKSPPDLFPYDPFFCLRKYLIILRFYVLFPMELPETCSLSVHAHLQYSVVQSNEIEQTLCLVVRKRTIPTGRPALVGEDSVNFCVWLVLRGQRNGSPRLLISVL